MKYPGMFKLALVACLLAFLALFQHAYAAENSQDETTGADLPTAVDTALPHFSITRLPDVPASGGLSQHNPAQVVGGNWYWKDGSTIRILPNYPATVSVEGVNDLGAVVGETGDGKEFMWKAGKVTWLGPTGHSGSAKAINDKGIIAGVLDCWPCKPWKWTGPGNGSPLALAHSNNVAGGDVYGMSPNGTIAGDSVSNPPVDPCANSQYTATMWSSGGGPSLLAPVANAGRICGHTFAFSVNDSGLAVGGGTMVHCADPCITPTVLVTGPMEWSGGGSAAQLATLPGTFTCSTCVYTIDAWAYGINSAGRIVGYDSLTTIGTRAVLWQNGQVIDLNTLIAANSGWTLTHATSINDDGSIIGYGTFGGKTQGFLLRPSTNCSAGKFGASFVYRTALPYDKVKFSGSGWNPKCGPIIVSAELASGEVRLGTYGNSSFSGQAALRNRLCSLTLVAKQVGHDSAQSTAEARVPHLAAAVLFAKGVLAATGGGITAGDSLCGTTGAGDTSLLNYNTSSDLITNFPHWVDEQGIKALSAAFLPVGGFGGGTVTYSGPDKVWIIGELAGRMDVTPFKPSTGVINPCPTSTTILSGQYVCNSSVTINGARSLDNAVLWVNGNLTVNGAVKGKGSIFATGNITVNGPINFAPSNIWTFGAGGQLRLGSPVVITIPQ